MERYAPNSKDLARDVVSRAMEIEIREGGCDAARPHVLTSRTSIPAAACDAWTLETARFLPEWT
jgi:succinate dehydrogenase/fumarate reductase flavoprotein subunit